MSTITKIEDQKNKKRVNIFVDDAFFCGLMKETAVIHGLKVGKTIDEKQLEKVIFDSEVKRAFEKASDYVGTRMHTKKELFDKLVKKGFEKKVAEQAISKMEEYNYVDDALFAKCFISENKKYSKRMLENKLKQKGISPETIASSLENRSEDDELEACKKHAKAYVRGKNMKEPGAKQKLYASLARRGYSFDVIKSACESVIFCDVGDEFPEIYD